MDYDREIVSAVGTHYDSITDGWRLILGDNFHFGYFESPEDTLDRATRKLIQELVAFGPIELGSSVVDIGCGVGEPAFYLHQNYACKVLGVTISRRGVEIARERSLQMGCSEDVTFEVVDILSNELPSQSYDVAWIMESSHLMTDKVSLMEESYRLLKPGGVLLLCDMVAKHLFTAFDLLKWADRLAAVDRTFGKAKTESPQFYEGALHDAGFCEIGSRDITAQALPTLDAWSKSVKRQREELEGKMSTKQLQDYLDSCDILAELMATGRLGYWLFRATKPLPQED